MSENLYTVQKTYEALAPTDAQAQATLAFDESRIFKTEYERQSYLIRLTGTELKAAISWLETKGNEGVSNHAEMLRLLKGKEREFADIQARTRAELADHALTIKALMPKTETTIRTAPTPAATEKPQTAASAPAPTVVPSKIEKTEDFLSFMQIANTLKHSGNTTKQVQNNAEKIQAELLKSPKKEEVLAIVETLVNSNKTNKDFQKSLGMPSNSIDGFIGPKTINLLLQKAGSDYKIPEGKEEVVKAPKDSAEPSAPKVIKTPVKPTTKSAPKAAETSKTSPAPVSVPVQAPASVNTPAAAVTQSLDIVMTEKIKTRDKEVSRFLKDNGFLNNRNNLLEIVKNEFVKGDLTIKIGSDNKVDRITAANRELTASEKELLAQVALIVRNAVK